MTKSVSGEVWLSDEIWGGEILKKPNFMITIRYKIPTFSSVEPFFKEGGRRLKKFQQEAEILEIFSIEVAIKDKSIFASKIYRPFNSPKSRFLHSL